MTRLKPVFAVLIPLVLLALLGAWWLGYFEEPAAEVSIEAASATAADSAGSGDNDDSDGATDPASDPAPADDTTNPAGAISDLTGTWNVSDGSFVGHRINEVLKTVGNFTVVARTESVTGSFQGDGLTITGGQVEVDMTTLTTDNASRDRAMRRQALETDSFPRSSFTLSEPITVDAFPDGNETVEVDAVGELLIHGVTRTVTIPLTAGVEGEAIVAVGQLEVALADFDIAAPTAPRVASVEETAILELSLILRR